MRSAGSAIKDCTRRERGARQRRGAGIVLNLFQLAPDRFIHEPAGLDRDHPRAISGADVGFQIGFHFNAPSFERGAPHAALAHRGGNQYWQRITLIAQMDRWWCAIDQYKVLSL